MKRIGRWIVGVLLGASVVAGAAWIHSFVQGYETRWAAADGSSCGRFASSGGRVLWQTCDVVSLRRPDDPFLKLPLQLPPNYAVGTNPAGAKAALDCGPHSIPFAFPANGVFFGVTAALYDAADDARHTRWACRWQEKTVSYWVVVLAVRLGPACELVASLVRKSRGSVASTSR